MTQLVEGSPKGFRTDVRPFEDAGPGTHRTRFGPRFYDRWYSCAKDGCKFRAYKWDRQAEHSKRKGHTIQEWSLDAYESMPERK